MSFSQSKRLFTAAILLSVAATANVFAQVNQPAEGEGIVRITDGRSRSASRVGTSSGAPAIQAAGYQDRAIANVGFHRGGGCPSGQCQSNYGQTTGFDCPTCQGAGYGNCPMCQGGCPGRGGCLFGEHYCKHSPDYGYSPPSKYPLHRRGVEYTTYYPNQWYGAGGTYLPSTSPMVYQPTDTTQLGFYYQQVPFWQPQPSRLPERPIPAQWHITPPPAAHGRYGRGYGACQNGACPIGYVADGGSVIQAEPEDGTSMPQSTEPGDVVQPIQPGPAAGTPGKTPTPATLPYDASTTNDSGAAPNRLPAVQSPLNSSIPLLPSSPNGSASPVPTASSVLPPSPTVAPVRPLPKTESAASGHIRRTSLK